MSSVLISRWYLNWTQIKILRWLHFTKDQHILSPSLSLSFLYLKEYILVPGPLSISSFTHVLFIYTCTPTDSHLLSSCYSLLFKLFIYSFSLNFSLVFSLLVSNEFLFLQKLSRKRINAAGKQLL